jgi:hypothetical protein
VGDHVQVVQPDDPRNGMVGRVSEITEEEYGEDAPGYNVMVLFEGDFDRYAFRGNELKVVTP